MRNEIAAVLLAVGLSAGSPFAHESHKREVPQEHSHNHFLDLVRTSLNLNNPRQIADPVFGLLGNAAAAGGAGRITNLDCLQQETADQAFTNAKQAGDLVGMAGALVYRALERNTGSVGLASVLCTETASNPEIAALSQHQDPASDNAASVNKGITLALAQQLAGIGVDPLLALEAGTFAPGQIGDPTAKGNSCDTVDDEPGCIFSEKLLVFDATEEEINSAVAGISQTFTGTGVISATDIDLAALPVASAAGDVAVSTPATAAAVVTSVTECVVAASTAAPASSCTVITTTVGINSGMSTVVTSAATAATAVAVAAGSGVNIQSFTGTLGGSPPPVVSGTGDRPFTVKGDTFVNAAAALQRSCSVQHNACSDAANSGALAGGQQQCETQEDECNAFDGLTKKHKRALDFGSCGNPTILFEAGLDGRNTEAFIAEDQTNFNHGSALNIAVIAGFICQRLGSPCNAPADVQASCTSASAQAVATSQNQAAADVFNSILGVGSGSAEQVTNAVAAVAATPAATVMTITTCT
ncbi:hypothetical protein A1O7_07062 [Cladophialophora yegresii CBS 114405]|uniref:Cell wall mannoprotein n=1 Tax=Cladophialophora yegresii CBS 114405 TaxID=1182544 RepID=W9VMG1_9EURO|nr:uncharacterized protein A1O7_07062 [Cladophialophora yegresii CBS 114405]EXJ56718.1 hypothetical protein A1O7_07062 [Cladophialophora yegresii CBS 114405]